MLAAHIKALMAAGGGPAKVLKTAARYTTQAPGSSRVWLARLAAEKAVGTETGARDAWAAARTLARGSEEEVVRVWMWGIDEERRSEEKKRLHKVSGPIWGEDGRRRAQLQELLRESMLASLDGVHEVLLEHYVTVLAEANDVPEPGRTSDQGRVWSSWKETVGHMGSHCLTSGPFWERVFERVAKMDATDAGGKAMGLGKAGSHCPSPIISPWKHGRPRQQYRPTGPSTSARRHRVPLRSNGC